MLFENKSKTQKIKEKGEAIFKVLFLFFLSLVVTSLMVLYIDRLPSNTVEGAIATQDIRADQNYEIIDVEATESLKNEAAASTLPIYTFDTELGPEKSRALTESFVKSREKLVEAQKNNKVDDVFEEELKKEFLIALGVTLEDKDYKKIRDTNFAPELEKTLILVLDSVQKKQIVSDKTQLDLRADTGIDLRYDDLQTDEVKSEIIKNFDHILTLKEAKQSLTKANDKTVQKDLNLDFVSNGTVKLALDLAPKLLVENLTFDKEKTLGKQDNAKANVQSIVYKLQKGQTIIRRGDRYEKRHVTILNGIRNSRLQTNILLKFLGVFVLVLSTFLILYSFSVRNLKRFKLSRKDLNFLGLLLVMCLAFVRLGSFLGSSMQDAVPFSVNVSTFYFLIPVAAGAMMVRLILSPLSSLLFSIAVALLSGLFLEQNFAVMTFYFLSSVVSAHLIGNVERRSQVLRKGLYIGLVHLVVVLSLDVINHLATSATMDWQVIVANSIFAFLAGPISALTLLALSPLMEAIFNYTTNIQLLELANMNHPLLREMIVRAPGTYLHSQLVGTLAESGTRAINGNSLLARVGSYYHDIGKMKKPQYFIENQKGENPHDTLAPSMSALIIDAHVKDGIEMAQEYKLPQAIADFIPEHQGTKLIGFFYHKALKEVDGDKTKVDERHYRYAGPKPQTRESGVVMLADTIEAAVRSMPDKSPQKIKAQVEKLINMHFVDGQLDECDLTLKDLHLIAEAFVKILIGIYHHRVEYPEDKQNSDETGENEAKKERNQSDQQSSVPNNISPLFKEKGS